MRLVVALPYPQLLLLHPWGQYGAGGVGGGGLCEGGENENWMGVMSGWEKVRLSN